jgi:peptidoglycan/LPS O-acetylase OafA/YrhL
MNIAPEMKQQHTSVINKPHFEVLDGLRGVAAIAVVIFHFMEIAVPDPRIIVLELYYCYSWLIWS